MIEYWIQVVSLIDSDDEDPGGVLVNEAVDPAHLRSTRIMGNQDRWSTTGPIARAEQEPWYHLRHVAVGKWTSHYFSK